jgi:hypothetical protein
MHPTVRDLIKPSLDRLGKPLPSIGTYINAIKNSPYYYDGFWNDQIELPGRYGNAAGWVGGSAVTPEGYRRSCQ